MNNFLKDAKFIDLTHDITSEIPTWCGSCGFKEHIRKDYDQSISNTKFRVQNFEMQAGVGTHIDAPVHCIPGAKDVANIELNKLIVPSYKIDVSVKSSENYSLSVEDVKEFEAKYQSIEPGSFIYIYFGWDKFWPNPEKYRNNYKYPYISLQAAEYLLSKNIVGLGVDTLSPDRPEDGFPVHHVMLSNDKYIIENVANSAKLPPHNFYSFIMPLKIKGATESPIRIIAIYK